MSRSSTATAEASGQSRFEKNSLHRTRPSISVSEPPSRSGMTNSPTIGIKQSRAPAAMPGAASGRVTLQNARTGPAPRSAAASRKLPSRRLITA